MHFNLPSITLKPIGEWSEGTAQMHVHKRTFLLPHTEIHLFLQKIISSIKKIQFFNLKFEKGLCFYDFSCVCVVSADLYSHILNSAIQDHHLLAL